MTKLTKQQKTRMIATAIIVFISCFVVLMPVGDNVSMAEIIKSKAIFATIGTVFAAIVLYVAIRIKNRKKKLDAVEVWNTIRMSVIMGTVAIAIIFAI